MRRTARRPANVPPVQEHQPRRRRLRVAVGTLLVGAAAGFLGAALLFGKPWHLPAAWGDIPTWFAAVAAIYGGYYALRQLREQQETIRTEFDRNRNLGLLLEGLLSEMGDREQARIREQAEGVDITWNDPADEPGRSFVMVINKSRRPIRDLTCWAIMNETGDRTAPVFAAEMYRPEVTDGIWTMPEIPATPEPLRELVSLRGGSRAGFYLPATRADHPGATQA